MEISDSGIAEVDLEVLSLSEAQWRVCDLRISEDDATRVIGFIERKQDLYEAMDVGHGFRWSTFPTLQAAIGHFAKTRNIVTGHHVLAGFSALRDSDE
jgi:hypothetical protein